MQVLNVARGGTLHQHLPDVIDGRIDHRQGDPGEQTTHWVSVEPASLLGETLGRSRTKVNSFHHQAVDRLGRRLQVTARASDGTVEAFEDGTRSFLVAVQWHAECLVGRPAQSALFSAFVAAAAEHEAARAVRPTRRRAAAYLRPA
jgi:putative glutamine amidotransferase